MRRRGFLQSVCVSLSFSFLATSQPQPGEWMYQLEGVRREEVGGDWFAIYTHNNLPKHLAVSFDSSEELYFLTGSDIVKTAESEQEMMAAVKEVCTR